jgi:NADH:ubiquinone oxidoreductase subunit 4 (subunit M)
MNYVVLGLFVFNVSGFVGAMFLMLSHGLVSSGLFMIVGFYTNATKLVFCYILVALHE